MTLEKPSYLAAPSESLQSKILLETRCLDLLALGQCHLHLPQNLCVQNYRENGDKIVFKYSNNELHLKAHTEITFTLMGPQGIVFTYLEILRTV